MNIASGDFLVLNVDDQTISLPSFPLFKFNEVNQNNCCINLKKKDGHYYAIYEDEEVLMNDVNFDECLLTQATVSFDEYEAIHDFVEELLKSGYTDFVLNKNRVIRLNCM